MFGTSLEKWRIINGQNSFRFIFCPLTQPCPLTIILSDACLLALLSVKMSFFGCWPDRMATELMWRWRPAKTAHLMWWRSSWVKQVIRNMCRKRWNNGHVDNSDGNIVDSVRFASDHEEPQSPAHRQADWNHRGRSSVDRHGDVSVRRGQCKS